MDAKMITIMINNIEPHFKSNHGFRNMDTDNFIEKKIKERNRSN